jgi:hypothetical protein
MRHDRRRYHAMNRLQVYFRQLAFACYEASASDDPRVIGLCFALLCRAPFTLWGIVSGRPFLVRLRGV